jgi:ATP11 protein
MSSMTRSSRLVRFSSTAFDAFTRMRISGTQHGLQRGVHEPALLVACPSCAPSRASSTKVAASAGPIPQGATRKSLAALGGFTYPGPRKLQDIVKLPLLNAHSAPKVEEIWTQYHKHHATAIADTCTQEEFGLLMQRTKRCPLFVIPIPR